MKDAASVAALVGGEITESCRGQVTVGFTGTDLRFAGSGVIAGPPRQIQPKNGLSSPRGWGRFFVQRRLGTASRRSAYFAIARRRLGMAHWRKRNPPASRFKRHLAGWAFAISVVIGTLVLLSLRGHV
jgi:hypothetical protein